MCFAACSMAEQAPPPHLQPVSGALTAVGETARWTIGSDGDTLFSLDLSTPGLLSVVARSDDGVDLQLTFADALGVAYNNGYFDNDPVALAGGEVGALLLPAGRVNVVIGNWGTPSSGRIHTTWLALPDAAATPAPSKAFIAATAVADGRSVKMALPPKKDLGDRTVVYLPPCPSAGTVGLRFDPPLGERVLMGVYSTDQPWRDVFDYERGVGTMDLQAAAGTGYFLVFEHWEDDPVPLTLERHDTASVVADPQNAGPVTPAERTRRAPR